jgi:hypothetical protein
MTSRHIQVVVGAAVSIVLAACLGPTGAPGDPGEAGQPGAAGSDGIAGSAGSTGAPGAAGSDGAQGPTGSAGAPAPDDIVLAGHWQYVSGPLFSTIALDRIEALDLTTTGTGMFYEQSPEGIPGCASVAYAVLDDTVVELQLTGIALPTLIRYALPDPDTLELVDTYGVTTTWTRVDELPDLHCTSAVVTTRTVLAPQPAVYSALASDGSVLWYSPETEGVIALDPTTGSLGSAIAPNPSAGFAYLSAVQGSDFWAQDSQGGGDQLALVDRTGAPVGTYFSSVTLVSSTFDTQDGHSLWIGTFDGTVEQLLAPLSDPSGSQIGVTLPLHHVAVAMTFANGSLWMIMDYAGRSLVEVDPTTGAIVETYHLPFGVYSGLAELGGTLYALHPQAEAGSTTDLVTIELP